MSEPYVPLRVLAASEEPRGHVLALTPEEAYGRDDLEALCGARVKHIDPAMGHWLNTPSSIYLDPGCDACALICHQLRAELPISTPPGWQG